MKEVFTVGLLMIVAMVSALWMPVLADKVLIASVLLLFVLTHTRARHSTAWMVLVFLAAVAATVLLGSVDVPESLEIVTVILVAATVLFAISWMVTATRKSEYGFRDYVWQLPLSVYAGMRLVVYALGG